MLQRIAALGDQHDTQAKGDAPDTQPEEGVEPTPQEPETDDPPTAQEQTKMISPVAAGGGSTGSEDPAKTTRKRRSWPWVLVVIVLLLGIGYVGVAFATEDDLPATLSVEGVDVSGKSVDEAAPVIEEELAARAERELVVSAAEAEASIVPAEAGYSYDVETPSTI